MNSPSSLAVDIPMSASQNDDHMDQKKRRNRQQKMFTQFENNLVFLQESLEKSNAVTKQMVSILDRFEERFSKLETEMMSMNERIDVLKLAHDNIDSTIRSIDKVLGKFNVANQVADRIEEGINEDLDSYLECMDKINEASLFMYNNRSFKGSEKAVANLTKLMKKALTTLEAEFKRILVKASHDIDPYNLPKEKGFEIMDPESVEQLHKIAQQLNSQSALGYLKAYKEIRSKVFVKALYKIYPESKEKKQRGAAGGAAGSAPGSEVSSPELTATVKKKLTSNKVWKLGEEEKDESRFYVKGSHKFIFFMNFYIKLLEAERRIASKIVFGVQIDSIFGQLVSPSLKLFIEKAHAVANRKVTSEKVCILLDALENFNARIVDFNSVLGKNTSLTEDMDTFKKTMNESASKMLQDYYQEVLTNQQKVFPDGQTHEVTTNAINYLKRLFEYSATVENLLAEVFFEDKILKGANTYLGRYIKMILGALETNLETKAKTYNKYSLACIFLLNNHHHILKNLQNSELEQNVNEKFVQSYQAKVKKDEKEYIKASWQKALNYLQDTKKIVVKNNELTKSSKKEIKHILENFNGIFEELYRTQRDYCIGDVSLREHMRSLTVATVIPVYKSFIEKYGSMKFSRRVDKYIKYDTQVMVTMLNKFFDEYKNEGY